MANKITYTLSFDNMNQHIVDVRLDIVKPNQQQKIAMAAWVPGSYMIRDFAAHVVSIKAFDNKNNAVKVTKLDKSTWQLEDCGEEVTVKYQVYCFDNAPRGALVNDTQVFLNGARIFLEVKSKSDMPVDIELVENKQLKKLAAEVATTMPPLKLAKNGFGKYHAESYLDAIEHPMLIANYTETKFKAGNKLHRIVINGDYTGDAQILTEDVAKICERHIEFFGEHPADNQEYLFILNLEPKGYGGIEYKSSTNLLFDNNAIPQDRENIKDDYFDLLSLFSHEYFHTWNVKRIKPVQFIHPDLSREIYTRQLWIFEGITSYYDELAVAQTELMPKLYYYKKLSESINRVQLPGAFNQSVADSSFDAWTKFYKQDENAINAIVSYYTKGSLIAFCLDILIMQGTQNKVCLKDIMQYIWQNYGRDIKGLKEGQFEQLTQEVADIDLTEFFDLAIRSTAALPLTNCLDYVGLGLETEATTMLEALGIRLGAELKIRNVVKDSPAGIAGISPKDEIIAINEIKVQREDLEQTLISSKDKADVNFTVIRNNKFKDYEIDISNLNMTKLKVVELIEKTLAQQEAFNKWVLQ